MDNVDGSRPYSDVDSLESLIQQEQKDEDFDLLEALNERTHAGSWTAWLREALQILQDNEKKVHWYRATAVCYWAISRDPELPFSEMEIVARLYWCLIQYPAFGSEGLADAENLVWSIAHELKGVGYNSDWDPMKDSDVMTYMQKMG